MPPPDDPPPPRRRWLRWRALALALTVVGAALVVVLSGWRADRANAGADAELDISDPGWHLADIEAARAAVPDHENGARLVAAARRLVPTKWEGRDEIYEALGQLRPNERLPAPLAARLAAELPAQGGPALRATRGLADRPRGRHRITYASNPYATLLPDVQASRDVCTLWRLEAERLAEKGDGDAALVAARTALNAGRSVGDEPFSISQLVRAACALVAARAAERALGLTEPGPVELLTLQRLAADEARHPAYRIAMRGERAAFHEGYKAVARGEVSVTELAGPSTDEFSPRLSAWVTRQFARRDYPQTLALFNRMVAVADAPTEKQAVLEADIKAEVRQIGAMSLFARTALPAFESLGDAFRRKQATMLALACALAAERHRLDHKAWPKSLNALVPAYLPAVPDDPYDALPLRYRLERGGAVVYSVGPDLTDNGGHFTDNPKKPGTDLGVRLFDPDRRRQPAPAPKEGGDDGKP